jgi:hypothetical protein
MALALRARWLGVGDRAPEAISWWWVCEEAGDMASCGELGSGE